MQAGRERARLIPILRAKRYMMTDVGSGQILSSMAKLGVFRLGRVLVGTRAFRAYEGELGVQIGVDEAAETDDIDIASFEHLSVVLGDIDDTQPNGQSPPFAAAKNPRAHFKRDSPGRSS